MPHGVGLQGSIISGALVVAKIIFLNDVLNDMIAHTSLASTERVPEKSTRTDTNWNMVVDITLRIDPT